MVRCTGNCIENDNFNLILFRPLKWLSPETLEHFKFSHASDVWAYGVTLWEIFSLGEEPYGDITDVDDYLDILYSNQRLPKPFLCPEKVFKKISKCWRMELDKRTTFKKMIKFLK